MEAAPQELGREPYDDEQPRYVPVELVKPRCSNDSSVLYHCYILELKQNFHSDIPVNDIVLAVPSELDCEIANMQFHLEVGRGTLTVNIKHAEEIRLCSEQVLLCRRFQTTIFRSLIDHKLKKLEEVLERLCLGQDNGTEFIDYLLLPAATIHQRPLIIDWDSFPSVSFPCDDSKNHIDCSVHNNCSRVLHTKNGMICSCRIQNSLVCTPHNGLMYCITGLSDDLNGNSLMSRRDSRVVTYKTYNKENHGINLRFAEQSLLIGRHIFKVRNYLQMGSQQREKESSFASVELPPELCSIIMSPLSIGSLYAFSFVPSIMHRLESLILAVYLKKKILDNCRQSVTIPTMKVLEAITTKHCQENFNSKSLETLGDSFLKYAASKQLFKTFQNNREGPLSMKREKIISNDALRILGCDRKLPGFIRNECFVPKNWIIPGDYSESHLLKEELLLRNIYIRGRRKVKSKKVADAVEALIGAFLSTGGEMAAIYFMNWVGINVDFVYVPYERRLQVQPEKLIDVSHLQSLLNYPFRDPSLLVEALTHGSYIRPGIPECYQRLEFLGDAVLDYAITNYFYNKYPGMSAELLTDMRSASVNNGCYARSAAKFGLHKHILASDVVHKNIADTVNSFGRLSTESTFGWECETSFSEVLADIIESLAGAIFVDSEWDRDIVFQSIRPLLKPLVSPETLPLNPVKELNDQYPKKKIDKTFENGVATVTVEVEANGITYNHTSTASNTKTAKRLACKEVLRLLKEPNL